MTLITCFIQQDIQEAEEDVVLFVVQRPVRSISGINIPNHKTPGHVYNKS